MNAETAVIRLAGVVRESIVDGPGIRFAVFCQGCAHHCKGCHNTDTHDFSGGEDVTVETLLEEIDKNPLLDGVTFTGGEPFCQPAGFLTLAKGVKKRGLNIVAFSGYTYEELLQMGKEDPHISQLMDSIDTLIDGPFVEEEKDLTLEFRGSKNQRIIDMNATRQEGTPVL